MVFSDMRVSVMHGKRHPEVMKRLQALGYRVQAVEPDKLDALDTDSTDEVCLVSVEISKTPAWRELRVKLARSSRFYIVYGDELCSREIVDATRDGAHDVLDRIDGDDRWEQAIESSASAQALWWQLYRPLGPVDKKGLVGRSSVMKNLRESTQRIGPTKATVLIMGESGTGKERVAEALQAASGRKPFVVMDCAAIPVELLESELFGAEKGAFTGANRTKPGLVEEAAGGTLFLDEIGELDITLQPKLLRFLESRKARRVGSNREYECDVRIISATNRDLHMASEEGMFRQDLYYRLSEIVLNTPPLKHHIEDIPDLAMLFLEDAAVRLGKNFERLEPQLVELFQSYHWPGNVRELRQVIERLAIYYDGPVMRASWWIEAERAPGPVAVKGRVPARPAQNTQAGESGPVPTVDRSFAAGRPLNKRERMQHARKLLEDSDGDLAWTAAQLGIHPTTLYRWRKAGKV